MRKRYVPDLVQIGALYESNYSRLLKLIRVMGSRDAIQLNLHNGEAYIGSVRIELLESSRYTDTFLLEQTAAVGKWVNNPRMTVRLYHDALVAEVIGKHGRQAAAGVNHYPNHQMHLPDEKIPDAWAPLISSLVSLVSDRFEVWCPHVDAEWTDPECSFLALLLLLAS